MVYFYLILKGMGLIRSFNIALMPGDGIGPEVTAPSFDIVRQVAESCGVVLNAIPLEAGAALYARTGDAFPEEIFWEAARADAIYLCAMGDPSIRYPDGTEIGPQHDLRKRLKLYAGIRPCIAMEGIPLPLRDPRAKSIDFVIVRESIEGIFAFPRKSERDSDEVAYNTIMVTREISEKLFHYSFSLARRRRDEQGSAGRVTCVDKANVLSSLFFFRQIFLEISREYPDIASDCAYVDATAMNYIKRPWDFDVCVTENQFGDILSDLAAALMGGVGMAPSAEIGDHNAVFQPTHGSAPHYAGKRVANPTGMILSGGMMLDYLGRKFSCPEALQASSAIVAAVKAAYASGKLLPHELKGDSGLDDILREIWLALERSGNNHP